MGGRKAPAPVPPGAVKPEPPPAPPGPTYDEARESLADGPWWSPSPSRTCEILALVAMNDWTRSREGQLLARAVQSSRAELQANSFLAGFYAAMRLVRYQLGLDHIPSPGTATPTKEATVEPRAFVGASVHYRVKADDDAVLLSNGVKEGDVLSATIVRVWGDGTDMVNLWVFPDGPGSAWKTSVHRGTEPGQWDWLSA